MRKKLICLLMASIILCSTICTICPCEELTYEEWYIAEHLTYLNSDEYKQQIEVIPGGEAGIIADCFEDSLLMEMNTAWRAIDISMDFVGMSDIELDRPTKLVRAAMIHTLVSDSVQKSFKRNFCNLFDGFLGCIALCMDSDLVNSLESFALKGSPDDLEDLSTTLKELRAALKEVGVVEEGKRLSKISALLDWFDEEMHLAFPKGISAADAEKMGLTLEFINLFVGTGSEIFHEMYYSKMLYEAYKDATDEWVDFWKMVMAEAAVRSNSYELLPGTGSIADEIEVVLKDVQKALDSDACYKFTENYSDAHSISYTDDNMAELCSSIAFEFLPSEYKAIMLMTKADHWVINMLTNMDDIADAGLSAYISAELTRCASFALSLTGEQLKASPDYEHACRFDTAFRYYKTLMLETLDYMIKYEKGITKGLLHKSVDKLLRINEIYQAVRSLHPIPEHQSQEADLELLSSIVAIWEVRDCHINYQLALIQGDQKLWNPLEDPSSFARYFYYAVTDLDGNGRLEIITTWMTGNGLASSIKAFEVNDTMDGLEPFSVESYAQPDFARQDAVSVYVKDGYNHLILTDEIRGGMRNYSKELVDACLQNGTLNMEILGMATTTSYIDRDPETTYTDREFNPISKEQFESLVSDRFPGSEEGKMTFKWIYYENYVEPEILFSQLQQSWHGFGCEVQA